jgi:NosR/NirI family transcriptional regulator, nitrous oxide reductase regulator
LRRLFFNISSTITALVLPAVARAQQRFPRPDFETDYLIPTLLTPEPRRGWLEYADVLVLLIVLSLVTWLVLKKRSRKGVLYISVFSLAYFGFYRSGCICPIGAIQNVALALADPAYAISLTALAFFMVPLLFALFAGRVFCGGACPLGVIQDLVIIKPIELPLGLRKALGLLPVLYLGLSVLYAVTRSAFIICQYDPFVGIFRMDAPFHMLVLGGSFLAVGMFVGRPYCRFLCPYGVLLNWTSSVSKKHLTITPAACIDCKLCERSCPMDAINRPVADPPTREKDVRRFVLSVVAIPLLMLAGGLIVSQAHLYLSRGNRTVNLAELLIAYPELRNDPDHIDVQTFLASGKTMDMLAEEATAVRQQFYRGGWVLGAFFGLVFGIMFAKKTMYRQRADYEPDKGNCLSCGRCMEYCPVGKGESMALTEPKP